MSYFLLKTLNKRSDRFCFRKVLLDVEAVVAAVVAFLALLAAAPAGVVGACSVITKIKKRVQ